MGKFTKAIRRMQEAFKRETEAVTVETKKGPRVKPHAKASKACKKCGRYHSPDEHRFHGIASHKRTHGMREK
jgi:hypothetical protein